MRTPVRLGGIEACRGIAATLVLLSHCAPIFGAKANFGVAPFGDFFQFGHSGVDFFFVLSGFLIALLHWDDIGHPRRLGRYARRRLTRIYPTYWAVLALVVPVDIFTHTLFDNYAQPLEVLKSVLLVPQQQRILDVTWSLYSELLFYALFGLAIFSRRLGMLIVGLWVSLLVARPFLTISPADIWTRGITSPMNFEFLAGVAAGWFFPRAQIARPWALLAFAAVCFACLWTGEDFFWLAHLSGGRFILRCLAYAAAATSVILALSKLELDGRIRFPGWLVKLGGASYLLYLVHVPALLILGATERHFHFSRYAPPWLLTTAFAALTVGGAVTAHIVAERPLLRALRKRRAPPAGEFGANAA